MDCAFLLYDLNIVALTNVFNSDNEAPAINIEVLESRTFQYVKIDASDSCFLLSLQKQIVFCLNHLT